MERQKISKKVEKKEEAKRKALARLSGVSPVHKEDLLELAAFVRGRKRKLQDWIPLGLYTILGFVAFFFGIRAITPSENLQVSLGSALVLELKDATGNVMTKAHFLPNDVSATNPLEALGYGAISFGVALIAIGLSLMPKMHDKELDDLVSSMAISMSDRLPSRPAKSQDSGTKVAPIDGVPVLSDHPIYDPYDPDLDRPDQ